MTTICKTAPMTIKTGAVVALAACALLGTQTGADATRTPTEAAARFTTGLDLSCRHFEAVVTATSGSLEASISDGDGVAAVKDLTASADEKTNSLDLTYDYGWSTGPHHWKIRVNGAVVSAFTVRTNC